MGKGGLGVLINARAFAVILWSAVVFASRAFAQFEGIVESQNTTTDELGRPQSFVMTMWIKNDMVRIETKGASTPNSIMIYRTDLKKIWVLSEDERSYYEISRNYQEADVNPPGSTDGSYSIKRTGKKKTIAGYECEQFIIKRENEETEIWGTKKLSHLVSTLSKALGADATNGAEGAITEVMKRGIYPLRSVTRVEGQLIESQEVTRIEPKALNTDLFSLPAGFKKQKGPELMQESRDERQ